jgi:hypothetical protein
MPPKEDQGTTLDYHALTTSLYGKGIKCKTVVVLHFLTILREHVTNWKKGGCKLRRTSSTVYQDMPNHTLGEVTCVLKSQTSGMRHHGVPEVISNILKNQTACIFRLWSWGIIFFPNIDTVY